MTRPCCCQTSRTGTTDDARSALLAVLAGRLRGPAARGLCRRRRRRGQAVGLGRDTRGRSLHAAGAASGAAVYCGTWQQPSARVHAVGAADRRRWRGSRPPAPGAARWTAHTLRRPAAIDHPGRRARGGAPARAGSAAGRRWRWSPRWAARPITPTACCRRCRCMERSLGVLSGRVSAGAAPRAPSGAEALLAARLAAQAFGAGDVGHYDELMRPAPRQPGGKLCRPPSRPSARRWRCSRRRWARTTRTGRPLMHVALQLRTRAAPPRPTGCSPGPTRLRRAPPTGRRRAAAALPRAARDQPGHRDRAALPCCGRPRRLCGAAAARRAGAARRTPAARLLRPAPPGGDSPGAGAGHLVMDPGSGPRCSG